MNVDILLENFEVLAEASNGVDHLKSIIFDLAVSGQLVERVASDVESPDLMPDDLKSSYLHPEITGWFVVPLGKCAKIFNGDSTSSAEKLRLSNVAEGLPYVATKDVGYGFEPILLDTGLRVPVGKTQYKVAPEGAVLICLEGGSAGRKMGILASQVCFGNKLFANVCRPWLDPRFLLICLLSKSFSTQFRSQLSGIIGGISKAKYSELSIPVPPLAEQKRIVAKVDELMALCDQLKQKQKQRDNLRTATRKSAIDAISTATTPEELEIAWKRINNNWSTFSDALEDITSLRRLILDLLMSGNLPATNSQESNWVTKKFDDLGQCRLGKMLDKAKNTGELRPYLRNTNVQWFRINKSDVANMRVSQNEADEFTLKAGDLLICEGGQPGRCSIVGAAEESLLFQKALHRFRPNDSTDVKFVAYSLLRASMNGTLEKLFTGVTIKHLTGQSLKGLEIAIPSIGEQRRVVAEVDEFMALCDQLESELKSRSEVAEKFARSVVSAA
jgi:type I restriction enzyme S subunit